MPLKDGLGDHDDHDQDLPQANKWVIAKDYTFITTCFICALFYFCDHQLQQVGSYFL